MKKAAFTLVELLVVISIIALLAGLILRSERGSAEAGRRAVCITNMSQLGLALHNYHEKYDVFPPAYVADATGKPLYSWRVLILPFIECQELYQRFRLDEPWDSEANRKLLEATPSLFYCRTAKAEPGNTSYVMIVGPGTISDGPHSVSLKEITDDHSRTILLAETLKKIPWSAPIDIPLESLDKGVDGDGIGSNHPGTACVVFVDRSVQSLNKATKPETLRALATVTGGEP